MTGFFIKRPVFTIVLCVLVSIIGALCYLKLPLRLLPKVNPPIISVRTSYPGADQALVENEVTSIIEDALSNVEGLDTVTSTSRQGLSRVTLKFVDDYDIELAAADVRNNVERVLNRLPDDAKLPTVSKQDANTQAIYIIAFSDKTKSELALNDYIERYVIPDFQSVPGVAFALNYSQKLYAMRIWLDPKRMTERGITVLDVKNALRTQNVEVPGGRVETDDRFYAVVVNAKLKNAAEFSKMIVRSQGDKIVRLGDVARVELGVQSDTVDFRVDSHSASAIGIVAQSNANPLTVIDNIGKRLAQLKETAPKTMKISVVYDEGRYIKASIHSVYSALIEAVILVLAVIFLFLGRWQASLIPVIVIPICLLGAFTVMSLCGFSLNTITLLAMVLAIGLVVDDAIVMVENITRHIEAGLTPLAASLKGSREIVFAIIAMTITLVAVYFPIGFMRGVTGTIFREFAFTLAGTVLISGVMALTLSPMMCAYLLPRHGAQGRYSEKVAEIFERLKRLYGKCLSVLLYRSKSTVVFMLAIAVLGGYLFHSLPRELAPFEDRGVLRVFTFGPKDSSFAYTDRTMHEVEKVFSVTEEVQSYLSQVGLWSPYSAFSMLTLKDKSERKETADVIAKRLAKTLHHTVPSAKTFVVPQASPLSWYTDDSGGSIEFIVMYPGPYEELHGIMAALKEKVDENNGLTNVESKLKWDTMQYEVTINRDAAADLGVSITDITRTLSTMLRGSDISKFDYGNRQYNVVAQIDKEYLGDARIIDRLYVKSSKGEMVPLSSLVFIHEVTKPNKYRHYARQRADILTANLDAGYTVGEAVDFLRGLAEEMLPKNARYDFGGDARQYVQASHTMDVIFALAIVFIYLILAAQFESFIDPLIVLVTVPLAITGAVLVLKLFGYSFNLYSSMGVVTLIGLISKHGILITDFANEALREGKSLSEAITLAAKLRLRPILMTTAAMVLGALPLVLEHGLGSEGRAQMALAIIGGVLFGTLFSLFIVPVAYRMITGVFAYGRQAASHASAG